MITSKKQGKTRSAKFVPLLISAAILCCFASGCGDSTSSSGASSVSASKMTVEEMSHNAQLVYGAMSSNVTMAVVNGNSNPDGSYESSSDGDSSITIGSYEADISSTFDDNFTGYYYITVERGGVTYALWSPSPIADSAKHQLTESEAENLSVGCYPYASGN
jgi:ABC-type oligopeptide transport system substrate-binding subunit